MPDRHMGSRLEYVYQVHFNHIHQISSFFLHQIQIMRCSFTGAGLCACHIGSSSAYSEFPGIHAVAVRKYAGPCATVHV